MFNIVLSAILYQSYSTQCFLPPHYLRLSKVRELLSIYLSLPCSICILEQEWSGLNPLSVVSILSTDPNPSLSLSFLRVRTKFLKKHISSFFNLQQVNEKRLNIKKSKRDLPGHSCTRVNTQKNKWFVTKIVDFLWENVCAFSVIWRQHNLLKLFNFTI